MNYPRPVSSREHRNYFSTNKRDQISLTDTVFNPADLLPIDDFGEDQSLCSKITNTFLYTIKISFILFITANIIGLAIDPKPLQRVYVLLLHPYINENLKCELPEKENTNDMNHFSSKLLILKEDLNILKDKLDNIEGWRSNMEHELSKIYHENLEEMHQYFTAIEQRIEDALTIYDADKMGMIDYALETAGGKIIDTPDTVPYPSSVSWNFGYFQVLSPSSASQVIQAGHLPGQCFAFHGRTGRIRIRLAEEIKITSVTLEHSPFKLLSDTTSCPRNFLILGVQKPEDRNGIELGKFVFKNRTSLQNFKISSSLKSFRYVELFIRDNYGKEEYTCVYRFRVHGIPSINNEK